MLKIRILAVTASAFVLGSLNASALSTSNCSKPLSASELYACTLKQHPNISAVDAMLVAAEAAEDRAGQFTNPQLEVKNLSGLNGGENSASLEASLNFPISDYLFARSARVNIGRAEKHFLEAEALEQRFQAKSQVILDLYRYRQITSEWQFVEEALDTFASIERQFQSRRARGPEQEIVLNLVTLAQGDYELKKNHLAVEKQEIESRFKAVYGDNFQLGKELLPQFKKEWPDVSPKFSVENSLPLQKSIALKNRAFAEKSAANVESWPKIVAGPVMERSVAGIAGYNSYGFVLAIDIPIFSLNGGGRAFAEAQKVKANLDFELASNRARLDSDLVYKKYTSAVASLKKSLGRENLAKKHSMIDRLFKQGLTSGSVIIEAHRQIWEFIESQHEHERTAMESLLHIYQLQGRDLGEVLQ